jgi:hypothetical protein
MFLIIATYASVLTRLHITHPEVSEPQPEGTDK